jgi:hypothetical protein
VSVEFREPALQCTDTASGVGPSAVIITGTSAAPTLDLAGLRMQCLNGKPDVTAVVTADGAIGSSPKPTGVGNLIKLLVSTTPTSATATVQDVTRTQTLILTRSAPTQAALQERITDDALTTGGGAQLPVADFVRIRFTNGEINGLAIGSVEERTQVDMQTSAGVLQIQTGPIQDKDNFFTHWEHS